MQGNLSSSKNNSSLAISPKEEYSTSAGASPRPTIRENKHFLFCVHIVMKYAPDEL